MDAVTGMDRNTGKPITGVAHLKQSIGDILSTRKGTRRERPEYGCDIPRMVDLPVTRGWISTVQAEAARDGLSVLDARVTFIIQGVYMGDEVLLEVTT
jgi:phage baseplate assembly protein W